MRVAVCTFAFAEVAVSQVRALEEFCRPTLFLPAEHLWRADDLRDVVPIAYSPRDRTASKVAAALALGRSVRRHRPDVLHLQGAPPVVIPALPLLRHFPQVLSVHDPVWHSGEGRRSADFAQRLCTRTARRIVLMSNAMEAAAIERYPWVKGKTVVIPLGVHDLYVEGAERRPPELGHDGRPFILLFGRLSPYKGVEDLLEAFARVSGRVPHTLVIAGRQLYPIRLPDPPSGRVVALDRYMDDDELRFLFRRSDLVVLPYRDATQSAVLMTAYAFGKAVLVTRVGGLPEMVAEGETGFVVPPGDPVALAAGLVDALGDPPRLAEMGRAAAAYGAARFSWREIARQHMAVYEDAAKGFPA